MNKWPAAAELRDGIRDALDALSAENLETRIAENDWNRRTFTTIKEYLTPIISRLQADVTFHAGTQHALAGQHGFDGKELWYDFSALMWDACSPHYLIQTLVAGEVELWPPTLFKGEAWDFQKILQIDAILCFMVWGQSADERMDRDFAIAA